MISDSPDKRYAAAVQSVVHLRGVLDSLLRGEAVDVEGAYDATAWAHLEKVFAIPRSDLAAVDPHETLGREAMAAWHHQYPWSGQKVSLEKGAVRGARFKAGKP
jgi:hypothetical protein